MKFTGWPDDAIEFYRGLEVDNSKAYWTTHRAIYDESVLAPMTALLAEIAPEFGDAKVFRPNRDVRFSADKSPYKTAIGALLADGGYVQLSADGLGLGAGYHQMESDQLARYRAAVADDDAGVELVGILSRLARQQIAPHGGDELKTVPRGYPGDHPRVDLLRRKSLAVWRQWPPGPWLASAQAKTKVVEFLRRTAPLRTWLDEMVGPSASPKGR
ncbi:MAG: DUF2461 domain-containing protein [Acidimicrobiales bacterium]